MFTGIVAATGVIGGVDDQNSTRCLNIDLSGLDLSRVEPGDSISVSGVCLTVTRLNGCVGSFDVSEETLARTLIGEWKPGMLVNLETALTLQTPLGGHLVSGHVDGVGSIQAIDARQDFWQIKFLVAENLGPFVAEKGSIAIDGVSLTINALRDVENGTQFDVMLVPHTLSHTTMGERSPGDQVHIEVDQVVRYILRLDSYRREK